MLGSSTWDECCREGVPRWIELVLLDAGRSASPVGIIPNSGTSFWAVIGAYGRKSPNPYIEASQQTLFRVQSIFNGFAQL